jgi:hypothetical protein
MAAIYRSLLLPFPDPIALKFHPVFHETIQKEHRRGAGTREIFSDAFQM